MSIKRIKKRLAIALVCGLVGAQVETSFSAETYSSFQDVAASHKRELKKMGASYLLGGSLGLSTSLFLGIQSKEVFPKLGYSLIQTLSSAAIGYGAYLYFTGDEFTREAEKIRDFSDYLEHDAVIRSKLSESDRTTLLNEVTARMLEKSRERLRRGRIIRGSMQWVTSVATGSTLLFSKAQNTAGINVGLGFICLMTAIGGTADFLTEDRYDSISTSQIEHERAEFIFAPELQQANWTLQAQVAWRF